MVRRQFGNSIVAAVLFLGCATSTPYSFESASRLTTSHFGSGKALLYVVSSDDLLTDSIYVWIGAEDQNGDALAGALATGKAKISISGPVPWKNERVAHYALEKLAGGKGRGSWLLYIGAISSASSLSDLGESAQVTVSFVELPEEDIGDP